MTVCVNNQYRLATCNISATIGDRGVVSMDQL